MSTENKSAFDLKTIISFMLAGGFLIGWQFYLGKKYGQNKDQQQVVANKEINQTQNVVPQQTTAVAKESSAQTSQNTDMKSLNFNEEFTEYSHNNLSFKISNKGMGLSNIQLKKYIDSSHNPIVLSKSSKYSTFELQIAKSNVPIHFNIKEESPNKFVGTAQLGSSIITKTVEVNPDTYSLKSKIAIQNVDPEMLKGLSIFVPSDIKEMKSSFLMPSYERQEFFVVHDNKTETVDYGHAKENINKEFNNVSTLAVGSQYFTASVVDKSEIVPSVFLNTLVSEKSSFAELVYKPLQANINFNIEQVLFIGPKSTEVLKAVDAKLVDVIDFGLLGFIAHPLLAILKWFFSIVGNWGIAIILLTLFVRMFVLPFNIMSFKSMKAMQKIQPGIQKLREKHKEDPLTLNKEMMALMKVNGANPMGGCLPMLLQIPVFFALFRVIGSSVELYQSPFFGWIMDLSSPDKFFVLPILMGITMFLQQKMTPTTMDPAQAKVMAFLPLVFSFFMLSTPSGLTLYMFVSGLFGIIQQYIFMRNKPAAA